VVSYADKIIVNNEGVLVRAGRSLLHCLPMEFRTGGLLLLRRQAPAGLRCLTIVDDIPGPNSQWCGAPARGERSKWSQLWRG
jgi:hypothetical protein